jgi:sulfur carrier protein
MVEIIVNGSSHSVADDCTVAALIQQLGVHGRYAVEINKQIVPRSQHLGHCLQGGDRVEIVQAIGGG